MRRIIPISLVLLALALPVGAMAQDDNSGGGAYTENPPSAGGNGDNGNTSSGTSSSSSGTSTTAVSPTTTTTPATTTTTPTSTSSSTEGTSSSSGAGRSLPATGSDTWILGLVAVALLLGGLAMRMRMRLSAPHTELGPQAYLSALRRVSSWDDRRGRDRRLSG